MLFGRKRNGDGVRAQPLFHAAERRDERAGIGHREADHAALFSHHGVIARRAVVAAVAQADIADTELLRLFNGELHGLCRRDLTETVVCIDERGRTVIFDDLRHGFCIAQAGDELLRIEWNPCKAVGRDAADLSVDQIVGDHGSVRLADVVIAEQIDHVLSDAFRLDIDGAFHKNVSLSELVIAEVPHDCRQLCADTVGQRMDGSARQADGNPAHSPSLMIASHGEGRPSFVGSLKKCMYLRQTVMI